MSDHIIYDEKLETKITGLINVGSTCYFNAMIQSLMSCTSLTKIMYDKKDNPSNNSLIKYSPNNQLTDAYTSLLLNPTPQIRPLWDAFLFMLHEQKITSLDSGQQDASEGLLLFIDMLHEQWIDRLFEHKHDIITTCNSCNYKIRSDDNSYIVEIYIEELQSKTIQEYIMRQVTTLSDYNCHKCKEHTTAIQKRSLAVLPEILIIQFKKYDSKWNCVFPFIMVLDKYKYKLIAQVNHLGSASSGHYNAIIARANNTFTIDDMNIYSSSFACTDDTYLLFYHIY